MKETVHLLGYHGDPQILDSMTHHALLWDATDHELEWRGSRRWRHNYAKLRSLFCWCFKRNVRNMKHAKIVYSITRPTRLNFTKSRQCSSFFEIHATDLDSHLLKMVESWKATEIQPKHYFLWSLSSLKCRTIPKPNWTDHCEPVLTI